MVNASLSCRRRGPALAALFLAACLGICLAPTGAAAAGPTPLNRQATVSLPLVGNLYHYVFGNRSRVVQAAFIGFGIGILILVTATRKH